MMLNQNTQHNDFQNEMTLYLYGRTRSASEVLFRPNTNDEMKTQMMKWYDVYKLEYKYSWSLKYSTEKEDFIEFKEEGFDTIRWIGIISCSSNKLNQWWLLKNEINMASNGSFNPILIGA